ncbi:site-specific integrase [Mucilaginibacter rubeus]|uniref:Site-specific integrase n=1 Tax=Mucilaginibacter rubeus TaxID=2027860 RepID=A0AAE6JDZ0_9SPHI|nr:MULTISPECIES: site-specific integrase [Mucilaginibacter]QEM03062.1 site-specific integrase [Mucilaginibacter rubeus]QEM15682.1 site-specific integrase [Mucilaginibacter gossypii]QTE41584.1 site-specific integrase [Mucilaginibacter rubeus]QTE48190.1 site-specific integrase [Mucilaginibacter rubeus]QTE59579.1 site-specific integrase [Mucilaginibacter rubeus]
MKTTNSFSLNFFIKKDKASKGNAPIYVRITVNGKFVDISLKRRVNMDTWVQDEQKVSGNTPEARDVKEKMRQIKTEINNAYDELRFNKELVTAEAIKAKVEGIDEEQTTLLWLMNYHNTEIKKLLEDGTMKNYYTTERYVKEFLVKKKKRRDIYLSQLDYKFIVDFEIYLRQREPDKNQRPCFNNTVMKHIERLRKMITIAVNNDWLIKDPFLRYERKLINKDREALELEELEQIIAVKLDKDGQRIVRDIFVFSCYTGLSFADMCVLSNDHLVTDIEGEKWIEMIRQKTKNFSGKKFFVMLLPEAIELINIYRKNPMAGYTKTIFPVFSNQVINRYLKAIGKEAKVDKKLTFHIARHTFATTITLENGVPIETVSSMLGHSKLSTTQIYSKVKKRKTGNDMKVLRERLKQA